MTVGYFSPLPPVRSGVADYAAALLPHLPARVNASGDVNLYHLGNNQLHREIYARALAEPGIIVLHDAVLHHFFLGSFSAEAYVEEFVYNYGEWSRELARELWASRSRSATDPRYFRYGMLRRIIESSKAVVVHTAEAAARVGPKAHVIPHYFTPPALPEHALVERWRTAQGLRPSTTLFSLLGYLRESKRVIPVLRAFARLRAERSDVAFLLAGEIGSSDLARAVEPHLSRVIREGFMSDAEFWLAASASDAVINLRYPSSAEASGISLRLMGIGKPVLTSDDFGLQLPTGPSEEEALLTAMHYLADHPAERRAYGVAAQERILKYHSLPAVAAQYNSLILQKF